MNKKVIKKSGLSRVKSRGFTLIEMMVAVFVFMVLFLIAASFVNLAAGSTKSNRTKLLTSDIRNTFDVINLKMNNANGHNLDIYGFKVNSGILGIASNDGSCTFFGKNDNNTPSDLSDDTIAMKYSSPCTWPTSSAQLDQKLTDLKNIIVDSFLVTGTTLDTDHTRAPNITVTISVHDADSKYQNDNRMTLRTSYTLDYLTINKFKIQNGW